MLPRFLKNALDDKLKELPADHELRPLTEEILTTLEGTIGANSKVKALPCWNLPPVSTCPSATSWCRSGCYARHCYDRPGVHARWDRNKVISEHVLFSSALATALTVLREQRGVVACRIHTGGDFYTGEYLRSVRIAFQYARVKPIVFTRAWRMGWFWSDSVAPDRDWLKRYGFLSVDPSTSPGSVKLLATMGFRIATASAVKLSDYKAGKAKAEPQTCLAQLGIKSGCSECQLCIGDRAPSFNPVFMFHGTARRSR